MTGDPAAADIVRLSVVIPCRNGEDTLGRQLESLAAQSWSETWEVVVADNGSTDRTLEVIRAFQDRLPNLRAADASDRIGVTVARNAGVRAARGKAIAFCDADDEVAPGWVAAMGDALAEHDAVAGRFDSDSLNPRWLAGLRGRPQTEGLMPFGDQAPYGAAGNLGVRRDVHEAVGGFDEDFGLLAEDIDYCWRIQRAGSLLAFEPRAVVAYRLRPDLRLIFRQARTYAFGYVALYVKYRPDLPRQRHPWVAGVLSWLGVFRHLPRTPTKKALGHFMWHIGWKVGMLEGSLRYRVVLLSVRGLPYPGMPGPA